MYLDIVDYFMKCYNWYFKFFYYKEDDKIKGVYFICNDQNIGILMCRIFLLLLDEIFILMVLDLCCFLFDCIN